MSAKRTAGGSLYWRVSKWRFLLQLPKVFKGTHTQHAAVGTATAVEVRIAADRPFSIYADGEQLTDLPATVRVLPGALKLIAPSQNAR